MGEELALAAHDKAIRPQVFLVSALPADLRDAPPVHALVFHLQPSVEMKQVDVGTEHTGGAPCLVANGHDKRAESQRGVRNADIGLRPEAVPIHNTFLIPLALQIVLLLRADALLHDGLALPIDIGTEPVTFASEEARFEGCEIGANARVLTKVALQCLKDFLRRTQVALHLDSIVECCHLHASQLLLYRLLAGLHHHLVMGLAHLFRHAQRLHDDTYHHQPHHDQHNENQPAGEAP